MWLTRTRRWCRFLIDTFGRELLSEGSGVLDVAGGKGELSFELLNLNGIKATVVEPRALQLWRQHKWMLVRPHTLHSGLWLKSSQGLRLRLPVEGLWTCGATCLRCLPTTFEVHLVNLLKLSLQRCTESCHHHNESGQNQVETLTR